MEWTISVTEFLLNLHLTNYYNYFTTTTTTKITNNTTTIITDITINSTTITNTNYTATEFSSLLIHVQGIFLSHFKLTLSVSQSIFVSMYWPAAYKLHYTTTTIASAACQRGFNN